MPDFLIGHNYLELVVQILNVTVFLGSLGKSLTRELQCGNFVKRNCRLFFFSWKAAFGHVHLDV